MSDPQHTECSNLTKQDGCNIYAIMKLMCQSASMPKYKKMSKCNKWKTAIVLYLFPSPHLLLPL